MSQIMSEVIRDNWRFLLAALALHAAVAFMLTSNFSSMRRSVVPSQLAIQARVIDQSAIRRTQERERQAEEDRQAKVKAEDEARQREEDAKQAAEQERQLEQKKAEQQRTDKLKADQQKQIENAQREATAKKQREQADKQRVADVKRKQKEIDDKKRAEQDAHAKAQRESELKQQLAEEEAQRQARSSGLNDQYITMIQQHIYRYWKKPLSAKPGILCEVKVRQAPGGTVLTVSVGSCNGDQAIKESIEVAVRNASPLPMPPDSRLFDSNLKFNFRPLD